MQGNVTPCPNCGGCGEIRVEWCVGYRYQDCTEWEKQSFGSREEAEAFIVAHPNTDSGCNVFVHEQRIPNK